MWQFYGSKPRYPKKRNILRTAVFTLLPLVLLLLIGSAYLASDDSFDTYASGESTMDVVELSEQQAYPQGKLTESIRFDRLLLEKKKRLLTAYHNGKPVRIYIVALGANPVGHKEVEGDKRTPEGIYVINDKNPKSAYHRNLGISYPNKADRTHAKSLGMSPGGDIKIHGLAPEFAFIGSAHRLTDWTFGCIAVTNPEIEELFERTVIGAPIEIRP